MTKSTRTRTAQAADQVTDAQVKNKLNGDLEREANNLWSKLGMQGLFNYEPPSAAKTMLIVVAKVLGYAVGTVATIFAIGALSMVLQTMGWPIFIIAVIELMGYVLGMLASWYASDKIVDFIVDGGVSRTIGAGAAWIKGAFVTTKSAVQRRFDGSTVH